MNKKSDKDVNLNPNQEKIKNKTEPIPQLIIITFYILIFFKNYIDENAQPIQTLITGCYILIGISTTIYIFIYSKRYPFVTFVFISMFIFSTVVSLFSKNYRIEDNILVLCYLGIAVIPTKYKLNHKVFIYFIYLILLFFLYQIITENNPNEIFNTSRNYISVLLIIGVGYYIISCVQNNITPSILIMIFSLIIAIWATGRGGIIAFSILLIFMPFVVNLKRSYRILLFVLIVSLITYSFYNFYDLLFEFGLGRFDNLGLEGDRSTMNSNYLNNIFSSFHDFIFGSYLMDIPSIVEGNPHNSFIRMHVYYGIFGFIWLISLLLFTAIRLFLKRNFLYLLLLIVLLIRSSVDSVAFHGPFDPIIFFIIFNEFNKKKTIQKI